MKKNRQKWQLLGSSITGSTHLKKGLLNQDAIKYVPKDGNGNLAIMAVADGHGNAINFRSDKGSKFAVDAGIKVLLNIIIVTQDIVSLDNIHSLKNIVYSSLPKAVCQEWEYMVDVDIAKNPFTAEEEIHLKTKLGSSPITPEKARVVYGSTLLLAAIKDFFAIYAQISDGDILVVGKDEKVSTPTKKEREPLKNETAPSSLWHPNNWNEFDVNFQVIYGYEHLPELILLSTDGYSNSFATSKKEGFEKIGSRYLSVIRSEGIDVMQAHLEDILTQTSERGSGDDITLGIIAMKVDEESSRDGI